MSYKISLLSLSLGLIVVLAVRSTSIQILQFVPQFTPEKSLCPDLILSHPNQCADESFPLELVPPLNWDAAEQVYTMWCLILSDVILENRRKASWNSYYPAVCKFIETSQTTSISNKLRILEIGTAYGGNADALATHFPYATIVAVDPFLAGYDGDDLHSVNMVKWMKSYRLKKDEFSMAWSMAMLYDQRNKHGCRYHLVKALSSDACDAFIEADVQKFDVVFIDGLHTYNGVKEDIQHSLKLVKKGGVLIFNDYGGETFPGVNHAVNELVKAVGEEHFVVGTKETPPGEGNVAIIIQ